MEAPVFEALILPHRSLSARGLTALSLAIGLGSGLLALRFWLLGAWPVLGFCIVETTLALLLLRLNARGARASECVLLSAERLRIIRTDARGRRQERHIDTAWLVMRLEERPGRVPSLWLRAGGRREEIGATLGESEKRDLARALAEAIHIIRNPVFDNPQLRETAADSMPGG